MTISLSVLVSMCEVEIQKSRKTHLYTYERTNTMGLRYEKGLWYNYLFILTFVFVYLFIFPPFIYFTSHLYCVTRFQDEDAICRIKYLVTRINGKGRI